MDSLLFCIFILLQVRPICKMGCFIRKSPKDWRRCPWKWVLKSGIINMLGKRKPQRRFPARWMKSPRWRLFVFYGSDRYKFQCASFRRFRPIGRFVYSAAHPLLRYGKHPPGIWEGVWVLSSRNPGSSWPGWGGGACGWPCFRSGGSVHGSRRRSGPPLPGCGCGRRTCRSACAARPLPAR